MVRWVEKEGGTHVDLHEWDAASTYTDFDTDASSGQGVIGFCGTTGTLRFRFGRIAATGAFGPRRLLFSAVGGFSPGFLSFAYISFNVRAYESSEV